MLKTEATQEPRASFFSYRENHHSLNLSAASLQAASSFLQTSSEVRVFCFKQVYRKHTLPSTDAAQKHQTLG